MACIPNSFVILIRTSSRDTGKTMVDASLGEIMTTCEKITWLLSEGEQWLKPEYRYLFPSFNLCDLKDTTGILSTSCYSLKCRFFDLSESLDLIWLWPICEWFSHINLPVQIFFLWQCMTSQLFMMHLFTTTILPFYTLKILNIFQVSCKLSGFTFLIVVCNIYSLII